MQPNVDADKERTDFMERNVHKRLAKNVKSIL